MSFVLIVGDPGVTSSVPAASPCPAWRFFSAAALSLSACCARADIARSRHIATRDFIEFRPITSSTRFNAILAPPEAGPAYAIQFVENAHSRRKGGYPAHAS